MLSRVIEISKRAGDVIMEVYNAEDGDMGVQMKDNDSPLTIADSRASDYICEELTKLDPSIPIICEETKLLGYDIRSKYTKFWLVDPLDGTKEFIKRNGEFTVNIALVTKNKDDDKFRPTMGVVYVPCTKTCYWGEKGNGAFKQVGDGDAIQIHCSQLKEGQKVRVVVSRSHLNDVTTNYLKDEFGDDGYELVRSGSSIKFMLVAEGSADIYPRLAPTMEWDTGASQIVVEEAGGVVNQWIDGEKKLSDDSSFPRPTPSESRIDGFLLGLKSKASSLDSREEGDYVQYNKENLLNPFFIAKN